MGEQLPLFTEARCLRCGLVPCDCHGRHSSHACLPLFTIESLAEFDEIRRICDARKTKKEAARG